MAQSSEGKIVYPNVPRPAKKEQIDIFCSGTFSLRPRFPDMLSAYTGYLGKYAFRGKHDPREIEFYRRKVCRSNFMRDFMACQGMSIMAIVCFRWRERKIFCFLYLFREMLSRKIYSTRRNVKPTVSTFSDALLRS